jgi:SAM-dependent methyltransferase
MEMKFDNLMEEVVFVYMEREFYKYKTDMCKLFADYRSDKSSWHNYTTLYNLIFEAYQLKDKPINLFELGLGTNNTSIKSNMGANGKPGASMRAFSDYFPNANIYGADIDKDILFQEGRIKTFFCDQTNPEVIQNMWSNIDEEFDVIIDDGLHEAWANIIFFQNSFQKLKKGGIYIIEDILNKDLYPLEKFLRTVDCQFQTIVTLPMDESWNKDPSVTYIYNTNLPKINIYDNSMAVIVK